MGGRRCRFRVVERGGFGAVEGGGGRGGGWAEGEGGVGAGQRGWRFGGWAGMVAVGGEGGRRRGKEKNSVAESTIAFPP